MDHWLFWICVFITMSLPKSILIAIAVQGLSFLWYFVKIYNIVNSWISRCNSQSQTQGFESSQVQFMGSFQNFFKQRDVPYATVDSFWQFSLSVSLLYESALCQAENGFLDKVFWVSLRNMGIVAVHWWFVAKR